MELFISPGRGGIVSFDPDSVLVLAYLYLGKCPINVNDTMHDDALLSKLPLLRHGTVETSGAVPVINYLRSQVRDSNVHGGVCFACLCFTHLC
ncbi:hypothetical protein FBUS_11104 [Fasciolopsis buskii]|uniref:Uncharacterized protein n=1 Tax=Fasciolopsis buskii TaxID=27845 RepID=A0A8E0VG00_9TREM|nr:hypothetical protein FBUS_11104 [Fasciolopsis buski]